MRNCEVFSRIETYIQKSLALTIAPAFGMKELCESAKRSIMTRELQQFSSYPVVPQLPDRARLVYNDC
jgi:hypothetical protein